MVAKYLVRRIRGTILSPRFEYVEGRLVSEPKPPFQKYWIFELQSGQRIPVFDKDEFRSWC